MKKVAAAIIKDKVQLLIAQRHSQDNLAGKQQFVGGKLEPGETPEECLVREINDAKNINSSI